MSEECPICGENSVVVQDWTVDGEEARVSCIVCFMDFRDQGEWPA